MNICKIDISNFRGIKNASILVSKNAVFVGDNNSGKSTLFEAVDLVMGPDRLSRSPVIDEHDFYAGEYLANDTPVQIKIEVTVIGLSEDQKIYFGNHIEWWDRCKGALISGPPASSTDAESVEPALRLAFQGNYNLEDRSNGKDIAEFGNDLLQGKNTGKQYKDVSVCRYSFRKSPYTHLVLKYKVLEVQKILYEMKKTDWSLAILVPTNALMLEVSDSFQREQQLRNGKKCPVIEHEVAVDTAGPYLAALTIASILETGSRKCCTESAVLTPLIEHILGRKGADKPPSKAEESLASALSRYSLTKKIQGKNREKLIADTQDIVSLTNSTQFSGNIISDWKIVLAIIENEQSEVYQNLLKDARHLRLLQRGSQLYAALDILWRENGSYIGATEAVANALTQEHFSMSTRKWSGVNVMTIHKSKGKEFDAVIVYEGRYQNRIISKPERREQATLNLRVAVTRAKEHTYILTPNDDPCSLL